MEEKKTNYGLHYLFITWIILFFSKIMGFISWDWWVVFLPLSPFILCIGIIVAAICLAGIVFLIGGLIFLILEIYEKIS